MTETKDTKKSLLSLFAHSVRDAKSCEEVNSLIDATHAIMDSNTNPMSDAVIKGNKTKDSDPNAALLAAIEALTKVVQEKLGTQPEGQPVQTDEVSTPQPSQTEQIEKPEVKPVVKPEVAEPKVAPKVAPKEVSNEAPKEDDDDIEIVKKSNTDSSDEIDMVEDEDIEDVETEDEEFEDVDTEDGCIEPNEGEDTTKKIMKDMKPILAQISNDLERKMVCDALAKSFNKNVTDSKSFANIMQATTSNIMPEHKEPEDMQSVYDRLNPHLNNKEV